MQIPNTVHVLGFTKNPEAMQRTVKEVERLGFKAEPFWNFPTPYVDFLTKKMPVCNQIAKRPAFLSCSLGHYMLWNIGRNLGSCPLFIVEDDCRFLKDAEAVHRALAQAPADADLLMLDSFFPIPRDGMKTFKAEREKAVNGWAKVSRVRSMACYIVGERVVDNLIKLTERGIRGQLVRICDQWLETGRLGDVNIYCAVPNLAIQQILPDCKSRNSSDGNVWKYKEQGTEHELYADW